MMEDVTVRDVKERWTGRWKGDLPLLSSLGDVTLSSCQRGYHGKVDGNKKLTGERELKE
jgi:hypothetical protein